MIRFDLMKAKMEELESLSIRKSLVEQKHAVTMKDLSAQISQARGQLSALISIGCQAWEKK